MDHSVVIFFAIALLYSAAYLTIRAKWPQGTKRSGRLWVAGWATSALLFAMWWQLYHGWNPAQATETIGSPHHTYMSPVLYITWQALFSTFVIPVARYIRDWRNEHQDARASSTNA